LKPSEIAARFEARRTGEDRWQARCLARGHDDRKVSLSISAGNDGRTVLHCHAGCNMLDVLAGAGLKQSDLFAEELRAPVRRNEIVEAYDYRWIDGVVLFQVCRRADKTFPQRRPDGAGGWIWGLGDTPRPLYRLPELIASTGTVFIVEGEKDVETLRRLGLVATCNPGGASKSDDSGKWRHLDPEAVKAGLGGREVIVIPDRDEPGRKHAADVARRLDGIALSARVVELPQGDWKDVSDWIAAGATADDVRALASSCPADETTAAGEPLVCDVRTFVGEDEPSDVGDSPEEWIVPGLVPRGCLTFLGGAPKLGKTWLVLDIALAIALGAPVCAQWPTYQAKVFVIAEEDPRRRIQSRLWWLARGRGIDPRELEGLFLAAMAGFRIDDPASVARLTAAIEAHRPDVIFVDALARIHGADENDRTAMRAVTLPLQELCARHGVAIVMVHHFRKAAIGDEQKRPGDLLRGTGDLHALARHVVGLTRPEQGGPLVLSAEGNYGSVEPTAIEITEGTDPAGRRTVVLRATGSASDAKSAGDEDRVLAVLRVSPSTGAELAAAVTGIANGRIRAATKRLAQSGRISQVETERTDSKGRSVTVKVWTETARRGSPEGQIDASPPVAEPVRRGKGGREGSIRSFSTENASPGEARRGTASSDDGSPRPYRAGEASRGAPVNGRSAGWEVDADEPV
jgi:5S rRNA maturation endonuclease (ribonuclease M5)